MAGWLLLLDRLSSCSFSSSSWAQAILLAPAELKIVCTSSAYLATSTSLYLHPSSSFLLPFDISFLSPSCRRKICCRETKLETEADICKGHLSAIQLQITRLHAEGCFSHRLMPTLTQGLDIRISVIFISGMCVYIFPNKIFNLLRKDRENRANKQHHVSEAELPSPTLLQSHPSFKLF